VQGNAQVSVPIGVLTAVCVVAVLAGVASLLIGAWDARRDEEAALQRYTDAQALLALPPVDLIALQAERAEAVDARAALEARLEPPTVDPASDAATSLLVNRATEAGLTVRGVTSVPAGEVKHEMTAYLVSGTRMAVEGRVNQIVAFLRELSNGEPGLVPALGSLTMDERGVARADLTFSVFDPVPVPTAVPAAVAP
jgi:hypothetical protein